MAKAQPKKIAAAKPKTKEEYFEAPPSDQTQQPPPSESSLTCHLTADQFFRYIDRNQKLQQVDSLSIEIRPAHSFDGSGLTITYGVHELHFSWDEITLNMRRYAKGSDV